MNKLTMYIILFMIYSFLGWTMEVILTLITKKKFVNRGFLIGPYCPIYGCGAILITTLLKHGNSDVLGTFLKSIAICSLLEYLTSYLMEKIFNAHWWDYSDKKFNINGRICLETMVPFGIIACLIFYIVNPFLEKEILMVSLPIKVIISIIFIIIFIIDCIISFGVIFKIKSTIKAFKTDNTEEINHLIKELLNSSILYRRVKDAFPHFKARIKHIEERIKTIKH